MNAQICTVSKTEGQVTVLRKCEIINENARILAYTGKVRRAKADKQKKEALKERAEWLTGRQIRHKIGVLMEIVIPSYVCTQLCTFRGQCIYLCNYMRHEGRHHQSRFKG